MRDFLLVGLFGFFGSVLRYSLYLLEAKQKTNFPVVTLVINTCGSFLAGVILAQSTRLGPEHRHILTLSAVGFIGAFTTFSTFSTETFVLLKSGELALAALNIGLSFGLGLLAVGIGYKLVG